MNRTDTPGGGAPRISVVIPTYNRAAKVEEAIRSVLEQDLPDCEVWVVDDGSTDGTGDALRPLLGSGVHYLYQENAGVTRARNLGIRVARGRYIALLDSDDICLPGRLQEQAQVLDRQPGAGVVFSDVLKMYPDGRSHRFTQTVPHFSAKQRQWRVDGDLYLVPAGELFELLLVELPLKPSTLMLRRSCLEEHGAFEEDLPKAEREFLLRLTWEGVSFAYIDKPLVGLRVWEGSIHLAQPRRGPEYAIQVLDRVRTDWGLDRRLQKVVRRGLAIEHYRLGRYWQDSENRQNAARHLLRAFSLSPSPIYLAHLVGMLLPRWGLAAVRLLKQRVLRGTVREPWSPPRGGTLA